MNWNEAIAAIDYDSPVNRTPNYADQNDFAQMFDLPYPDWSDEFDQRLKKYWIVSWLCTDSYVGLAAYKLDGEVVAVSSQQGRKCDENITFVSAEAAKKVHEFLKSLCAPPTYLVCDLTEEIHPSWFESGE